MQKPSKGGPRARWWNDKRQVDAGDPHFQQYQFEGGGAKSLGRPGQATFYRPLSPDAHSLLYGDKSLAAHVCKLLDGIHDVIERG